MKELFNHNIMDYEVDRIKKTNRLISELTGMSINEFFKFVTFSTPDDMMIMERILNNDIDGALEEFITKKYNDDKKYFNDKRDWRKFDSFLRSILLGWMIEDATIQHLNKCGVGASLYESDRSLFKRHGFAPDTLVCDFPVEVMTHYYSVIADNKVFYIKKGKFKLLRKFNSFILLYDVHDEPVFTVFNVNDAVVLSKEKKLIGGKRGYVIDMSDVEFYKIKEMCKVFKDLCYNLSKKGSNLVNV